jgi:PIN domain nuclease of toxin-antitoxin system
MRWSDLARHARRSVVGERMIQLLARKAALRHLRARRQNQLAISAISLWEITLLAVKGRLEIRDRSAELRAELINTGSVELALTGDIALLAVELKNLHGDPADRFIAQPQSCMMRL